MLTWGQGLDFVVAACVTVLRYMVFAALSPCIHSYSDVVQVSNKLAMSRDGVHISLKAFLAQRRGSGF
jgi:hypothetical protein